MWIILQTYILQLYMVILCAVLSGVVVLISVSFFYTQVFRLLSKEFHRLFLTRIMILCGAVWPSLPFITSMHHINLSSTCWQDSWGWYLLQLWCCNSIHSAVLCWGVLHASKCVCTSSHWSNFSKQQAASEFASDLQLGEHVNNV